MGKRTTTRHKEDNTFRFESNAAKVRKISLNTSLEIRDPIPVVGDQSLTALYQCIQINSEKNNSEDFLRLAEKLNSCCRKLEQILHEKDYVVSTLLDQLSGNVLSDSNTSVLLDNTFKETTELIVALAHDIRGELVPYLPKLLDAILMTLSEHGKAELVEPGFRCLSQLFNTLRKYVTDQFKDYLNLVARLWKPKQKHIVSLSASSLGLIAKKNWQSSSEFFFNNLNSLINGMKNQDVPDSNTEIVIGLQTLLFEMTKGAGEDMNFSGIDVVRSCLTCQIILQSNFEIWFQIMEGMMKRIVSYFKHATPEKLLPVLKVLCEDLKPSTKFDEENHLKLKLWNTLLNECPQLLLDHQDLIVKTFEEFVTVGNLQFDDAILESADILVRHVKDYTSDTLKKLVDTCPFKKLESIRQILTDTNVPFKKYAPYLIDAYVKHLSLSQENRLELQETKYLDSRFDKPNLLLSFFCKSNLCSSLQSKHSDFMLRENIPCETFNFNDNPNWICCCDVTYFARRFYLPDNSAWFEVTVGYFMAFNCMESWCERCRQECRLFARDLMDYLGTPDLSNENEEKAFAVLHYAFSVPDRVGIMADASSLEKVLNKLVQRLFFHKNGFSLWALKLLSTLLHFAHAGDTQINTVFRRNIITYLKSKPSGEDWKLLLSNLTAGYRMVRIITLDIISNWIYLTTDDADHPVVALCKRSLKLDLYQIIATGFPTEVSVYFLALGDNLATRKTEFEVTFKYALGLLHTNHKLVQEKCVEFLRGYFPAYMEMLNLNASAILEIVDIPVTTLSLPICDKYNTLEDLMNMLKLINFRLPNAQDVEERLDVFTYRANLFRSCSNMTDRNDVGDLFLDLVLDVVRSPQATKDKSIVPLLQFLSKFKLPKPKTDKLYEAALDLLLCPTWLSVPALDLLISLRAKELKPYANELKELQVKKNNELLLRFGEEVQNPLIQQKHRVSVIPVVSRLLLQKCKGQTKAYRNTILRCVAGFTEAEIFQYIQLATSWKDNLETRGANSVYTATTLSLSLMMILGYKFPDLIHALVEMSCDAASALDNFSIDREEVQDMVQGENEVPPISDVDENNPDPLDKLCQGQEEKFLRQQRQKALNAVRMCISYVFSKLSKLQFEESLLTRIFNGIIAPAMMEDWNGWTSKLLQTWSLNPRFHIFFSRRMVYKDKTLSPALYLLESLTNESLEKHHTEILNILMNLLDGELAPDEELLALRNDHYPPVFKPTESEPIGVQIILWGWQKYISPSLTKPALLKEFCQKGGHRKFELLSRLTEHIQDNTWSKNLCLQLVKMVPYCKGDEDNICELLTAIQHTLKGVSDQTDLLIQLAPSFSRLTGRRVRERLCDVLKSASDETLASTIQRMNSWEPGANDMPDYVARQESIRMCQAKVQADESFNKVFFTLAAYNCFYILHEISDYGEHSSAVELLEDISKFKPRLDDCIEFKTLIEKVILTEISKGLKHRDQRKFNGFLKVLQTFIINCQDKHGTLSELELLLDLNVLEGLTHVKVNMRTRSLNSLAKALEIFKTEDKHISPATLVSYVLPLAAHYLNNEDELGGNKNELVDASIQVLTVILQLVPYKVYLRYLTNLLSTPVKNQKLVKQNQRILMATMDAFHYDLSTATMKDDEAELMELGGNNWHIYSRMDKTAALKFIKELSSSIIPKLQDRAKLNVDLSHKHAQPKSKLAEDAPELKLPFVTSLVRLLQKLPTEYAADNIRPIIPSFCSYMRSKDHSVRDPVRKTLAMLLKELGYSAFPKMLSCLMAVLKRGYEKHVLSYTVAYIIRECETLLTENPEGVPMDKVIKICEEELFGEMQAEKDVQAIKDKTREARKDNAGPILEFCARVARDSKVIEHLIRVPMENLQQEFKSNDRMIKNARHWFASVRKGMALNTTLPIEDVMCSLLQKLNSLSTNKEPKATVIQTPKSIFEIPSLKKSHPVYPHVDSIVIEFIFTLLWTGLKDLKVSADVCLGYAEHLLNGLDGATTAIELLSMRCLAAMIELGSLTLAKDKDLLIASWRKLILKMSTYCLSTSTDPEMVNAIFKFITNFLESYLEFEILVDDYKLMLRSIKCFLANQNCSTQAIYLLRKLIARKYRSEETKDIMSEVQEKSITSYVDHIRDGCRTAYLEYIRTMKSANAQVNETIAFYLEHLKYPDVKGRESAAQTLTILIDILPLKIYEKNSSDMFFKVIVAVDQETDANVRTKLCEAFKNLVNKESTREKFISAFCVMISDRNNSNSYHTFARLAGLFLSCDSASIGKFNKLATFVSFYKKILSGEAWENIEGNEQLTQRQDEAKCIALDGLVQLYEKDHDNPAESLAAAVFEIVEETSLDHPNIWIKMKSLDFILAILSRIDVEEFVGELKPEKIKGKYHKFFKTFTDIADLIRKLATVLEQNPTLEVGERVANCLEVLTKAAVKLYEKGVNLVVLKRCMKNLRYLITTEVIKNPDQSILRNTSYKMYLTFVQEAVLPETVCTFAGLIVRHCVRDTTDANAPRDVILKAEQIMSDLKSKIGSEKYLTLHAETHGSIASRRQDNRAKKHEKVVLHPGLKRKRSAGTGKKKPTFKGGKKRKIA